MSQNRKSYDEEQTPYLSFNQNNKQQYSTGVYYTPNSINWLHQKLYKLASFNIDNQLIRKQWITLWNNNFKCFSQTYCNYSWNDCQCSFHRYQRWNQIQDNNLAINSNELAYWTDNNYSSKFLDKQYPEDIVLNENNFNDRKQERFCSKFHQHFNNLKVLYHFTLTSNIRKLSVFRKAFDNLVRNLRKKKISWQRARILEVQLRGCWHLHIAGTYLPINLQEFWIHGFSKVSNYSQDNFEILCSYLKKDFTKTTNLLPKNSKLLYRFDNERKGEAEFGRRIYQRNYYSNNKQLRNLQRQHSRLKLKIDSFAPDSNNFKLIGWKDKLKVIEKQINVETILKNNPKDYI